MVNLRNIDLNLLLTLDVLLTEQHVTRAAERLSLSQPAVSVHLARLRKIFGDPLLLPGPRRMLPTRRAEEIHGPLREALAALERALAPDAAFDPGRADLTWRIAASDYSETTAVLPALAELASTAPGIRLAILGMPPSRIAKQAEQGEVDLAFHTADEAPPNLRRRLLFQERYVLAGRKGHPRLRRRPTVAQFCKLQHAVVSPDGGGFRGITDAVLAEAGLKRKVALSVPHFLFLKQVLTRTDLVAMLPARLIETGGPLQAVEPPVEVPGFDMLMLWHERVHRDPAHEWLRGHILRSVAGPEHQ